MLYLVTTKLSDIPTNSPVVMLDGTVPGWNPGRLDLHYDHHRQGGSAIQIDEMSVIIPGHSLDYLIVTTQLDADACVAAAYFQRGFDFSADNIRKLRAIAYDCDHLTVPEELEDLKTFAAKAVATFKVSAIRDAVAIERGLDPAEFKNWSEAEQREIASENFKRSTEWLIDAALGKRPWPGESGEADAYQAKLEADAKMLLAEDRVWASASSPIEIGVGDGTNKGYIDPRSFLLAWEQGEGHLKEPAWTLTFRNHKSGRGIVYTLASKETDLTTGIFGLLTTLEKIKDVGADGWGGRATVGGSGWNTPSNLSPHQIIDAIALFLSL